jgi:hypothetical protein
MSLATYKKKVTDDLLVNDGSNEEVESNVHDRDFEWEDNSGQQVLTGGFGLQGAAKYTNDILKNFEVFFSYEFWQIVELVSTIMQN